jgi:C4-type Zn-finger protein
MNFENVNGWEISGKEKTMICPKCKAKIGLYRFEARTQSIMAQGMTCPVCGYWEESGMCDWERRKIESEKRRDLSRYW